MRPEPSKFIMKESRGKKMIPFCMDSIKAEKYKQIEEEEKQEKGGKDESEIIEVTSVESKKVDNDTEMDCDALKSRNSKLSVSSVERTSDEEESQDGKPNHSYISLIANAILSAKEKRLVLSDIYQYVLDTQPYFRNKAGQGWRNSIRHNLSLNECFIKAGRSPNGKGHFWAINPANIDDFSKGDFRRRRAQRRARRAMAFGDLVEHCSPYWSYNQYVSTHHAHTPAFNHLPSSSYRYSPYHQPSMSPRMCKDSPCLPSPKINMLSSRPIKPTPVKRGFDVESLLRDDDKVTDHITMERIAKRPSSTEISPPLPFRISPYTRLNLDYFADKRISVPTVRNVDIPIPVLQSPFYDRCNPWHLSSMKTRTFRDEHLKI